MSMPWVRALFLVAVVACAGSVAFLSFGLTRQSQVACKAANRSLATQTSAWAFLEQTVRDGWKTKPPSAEDRRQAERFFNGIRARLVPAHC